jgi:hypothetical protein
VRANTGIDGAPARSCSSVESGVRPTT